MNRVIKTLLLAAAMMFSSPAIAQQPQTQTAPLYAVNAKYTNGVAPGYYATSGGGLTLNVAGGTVFCSGSIAQYAGGTLTLVNGTTNYVYLNSLTSCTPAVKTTVFTSADIPLFQVTTSGGSIVANGVVDVRTPFTTGGGGGGGLTLPLTSALTWSPTSLGVTSLQNQLSPIAVTGSSVTVSTANPGANYTNAPALTQTGGTCLVAPTIRSLNVSGTISFQLTNAGSCTIVPAITVGSDPTGSGASITLALEGATVQTTTAGVPVLTLNSGYGQSVQSSNPFLVKPVVDGLTLTASGVGTSIYPSISISTCPNLFIWYNGFGTNIGGPCNTTDSIAFSPGTLNAPTVRFETIQTSRNAQTIYAVNGNNGIGFNPYSLATNLGQPMASGFEWYLNNSGTLAVSSYQGGTGYTGPGTCALTGGVQLSGGTDTCSTALSSGVILLSVTTNGVWSTPPIATITGAIGGTGATSPYTFFISHLNLISGSLWQDTSASHAFHITPTTKATNGSDWMSVSGTTLIVPSIKPVSVSCLHIDNTGNITPTSGDCATGGSGSVTSVALTVPSYLTVSGSPVTTAGTLAVTGVSQTANLFLASPNGSSGVLAPRVIVAADIPTLNQNTTGTAANLSGTPALPNGTTATTQTAGDNTTKIATDAFVLANAGGTPGFGALTSGTNTVAAMLVGTGASLGATGSGTITATSVPASGLTGSTLASGVTASSLTSLGTITTGVWNASIIGAQYGGTGLNSSASTGCPSVSAGTWSIGGCGITGTGTTGFIPIWSSSTALGNSLLDYAVTTAGTFTFTKPIAINATGVPSQANLTPSGTSPATVAGAASLGVPNTVTTAGVYLLPAAPGSGVYTGTNASGIVTTTFTALNGAGAGIPTGPTSSTTNDAVIFTGTAGQIADSGGPMPATLAAVSHQFVTSYTKSTGVFTLAAIGLTDLPSLSANTVLGALTTTTPSGLAVPSCSGASNALIWTSGTGFGCNTISGGGGLPSGTTGQGIFYATGGTTGTATSDIIHTGATAGSPLGFNNPTPLSTFDFIGTYSHLGAGPTTNTTTNGSLTNVATSVTVVSTTGYPPSGYLLIGSNNFAPEIVSYSTITSGTVFGGLVRSLFGTTAANPQATAANVLLIETIQNDNTTSSPAYLKIWKGGSYCFPSTNNLINSSTVGTGNFGCGNSIYANSFAVGGGSNGASISPGGAGGIQFANSSSTAIGLLNNAGLLTTTGNSVALITATTITATSLTTTGLVLPSVPISTTIHGHCSIIWEQNTVVGTVQFGIGASNAPTDLWVMNKVFPGSTVVPAYTTITTSTTTAISATSIPGATATGYSDDIDFTLITGGTNPVVLTIYGLTSVGTSALVIEPGSSCGWLL